jgi:hypothetical protein
MKSLCTKNTDDHVWKMRTVPIGSEPQKAEGKDRTEGKDASRGWTWTRDGNKKD